MAKEAEVQAAVRLAAAKAGVLMWRNNVGCAQDATGRVIRYGLANDSAQLNAVLKSADLVGIRPVVITEDMVGSVIGQFVSREVKGKGTSVHPAQVEWMRVINACGGDAKIVKTAEAWGDPTIARPVVPGEEEGHA
jgi:ribulose 1,5-bisphosphate synthetase/thiazole synthase